MPSKKVKEGAKRQYTFCVSKADEIFDYLMKVKFIKFIDGAKELSNKEIKGKDFYKWHQSFGHSTSNCLHFRNIVQDNIDNGLLQFVDK